MCKETLATGFDLDKTRGRAKTELIKTLDYTYLLNYKIVCLKIAKLGFKLLMVR